MSNLCCLTRPAIGGHHEEAATATGLRRAVWATLTEPQQARLLDVARRRASKG